MMTSPEPELEGAAGALRQAASRDDFRGAKTAALRYVRALEAGLAGLGKEDARARLQQGLEVIEWSRRRLCAGHARIAGELAQLGVRARYTTAGPQSVSTWNLKA
jgi:hypothetical protein